MAVPAIRLHRANAHEWNARGEYVLYWMIAARRTHLSFALDRAIELALELKKPLLVFEPLRAGYRWASARHHTFVIEGMRDQAARFAATPVTYFPYVEPAPGVATGLLEALAARAAAVVTDDSPVFFLPGMVAAASRRLTVGVEKIDSNGILPLHATTQVFPTAHAFRRFLQRSIRPPIEQFPTPDPLAHLKLPRLAALPAEIAKRWPPVSDAELRDPTVLVRSLPIDQEVGPVKTPGGEEAGRDVLTRFIARRLSSYAELRNHPDENATSELSPYLHFGHVSPHEVFVELAAREKWTVEKLGKESRGARAGFWGMSESAEAFLDQLVTWRELGFNMAAHRPGYELYEALPEWARATLDEHAHDPREFMYDREELTHSRTHDELWNAAQRQLVREGRMHNYLRMLWGKKILEWSPSPRVALEHLLELNNRYALDGRDPNSITGIFWTLGRYDRAWGPERPIFGTVRFMSSTNTRRKLRLEEYLAQYGR